MLKNISIQTFIKYNIASIIATLIDFLVLIILTEFFAVWYFISAIAGAISGGITSFVLGRNWAFNKKNGNVYKQALRYALTWTGSILLNVGGIYFFVDILNIQYVLSKIIVAIIVGLCFNYLMQKYFIFR